MIKNNEHIGDLIKCLLIHMKIIQVRMQCSTHLFKGDSKHKINQSVNKVELAINSICEMTKSPELVTMIKKSLDKVDLVYHMVLAEQLYDINEETLLEITDLIDDYLLKKSQKNEQKDQMGNGDSSEHKEGLL